MDRRAFAADKTTRQGPQKLETESAADSSGDRKYPFLSPGSSYYIAIGLGALALGLAARNMLGRMDSEAFVKYVEDWIKTRKIHEPQLDASSHLHAVRKAFESFKVLLLRNADDRSLNEKRKAIETNIQLYENYEKIISSGELV